VTPAAYRRILLVRLTSFGDVVRVTGFPGALRAACPKAEIVVVTDRSLTPLFDGAAGIDRLIAHEGASRLVGVWREARRQLGNLRKDGGFDLAVDLQGIRSSAAWIYASGARRMAGRGGFRPGWRFAMAPDYRVSDVAESAAIFGRLGIPIADPSPILFGRPANDKAVDELLRHEGLPGCGFLIVNPFGRWPSKDWPAARFARLLPLLRAEFGLPLIVTGGPTEAAMAKHLLGDLPPGTAISLAGRLSIGELVCLLRRARLVLTGDSGPMHAAAAVGTPVVALFGSSWPERAGPWGPGHRVLQRWRPATHHAFREPASAAGMAAIEVEDVRAAVAAQLDADRRDISRPGAAMR
jgi:lipopolysaccharide heptosyltransferase I